MNKKISLGTKLNIKLKSAKPIKNIEIVHSKNGIMFYAITNSPVEELTSDQISDIYNKYLNLGRTLYKEAKEKDNILKLKYKYYPYAILNPNLILEKKQIDDDMLNIIKQWKNETEYKFTDKYEFDDVLKDSLFLKVYDNQFEDKIKEWSKNNILPYEYDLVEKNKFQINIGRIMDISIFIYLVTYALDSHNEDNIKFSDFIEISTEDLNAIKNDIAGNHNMVEIVLEKLAYMKIISHVIDSFEEMNKDIILTKEILEIDKNRKFFLRRCFSCIEAIIFYIFKQYIINTINFGQYNTLKNIQVNICKKCGATITGTNVYCEKCSPQSVKNSKRKSREELHEHLEEINNLFDKYKQDFPDELKKEISYILNLKAKDKDKNKRKIDNLLNKIKKWERTK